MNGRTKLKNCLIISIFLLGMACTTAAGRTIYVDNDGPADFNTIQAAIDDSNNGDTIIVKPGLYMEHIRFYGKNITVTSTKPSDFNIVASTIIDYGVVFDDTEEPNCTLTGFRINGWIYGGVNHTHATISHCLFGGNITPEGIVISNCDGRIINCLVAGNGPMGDAISSPIWECHGLIKNCTVAGNLLGIRVGEGRTIIENCII